jgi:hypothetical protein
MEDVEIDYRRASYYGGRSKYETHHLEER